MHILSLVFIAVAAVPSIVTAQGCSTAAQQYNPIPGFSTFTGCYPTNYLSTFNLGATNPSDAETRCKQQCTIQSQCAAVVIQLNKAADSNNYSGTCFFFNANSIPTKPRECVDKPTALLGFSKEYTLSCLLNPASAASATAFCSSYLGIGVKTSYTSTSKPLATISTTISLSSLVTITSTTLTTATITSTSLSVSGVTQTVTTLTTTTSTPVLQRRAVAMPTCIAPDTPASRISSACSCLAIASSTLRTYSTAPTSTKRSTILKTSTSTSVTVQTIPVTQTTTTTTVSFSSTTTTTTSIVTTTPTLTCGVNGYGTAQYAIGSGPASAANFADCSAVCKQNVNCKSFGYGGGQCALYSVGAAQNARPQSSQTSYYFNDRDCPAPAAKRGLAVRDVPVVAGANLDINGNPI